MNLAFLGFAMIIVFMALIMAKKLSPFTSLILVPVAFGLLAGYGWDTLGYAMDGIKSVASTFAMMTFAILYFGVMLTAGMFDPMVDHVVAWCKGDPLKVLVGTAILAAFVSLDGDGTTTVMICCTAMIPIYNRLKIKKDLPGYPHHLTELYHEPDPLGRSHSPGHVGHEAGCGRDPGSAGAGNGAFGHLCGGRILLPGP